MPTRSHHRRAAFLAGLCLATSFAFAQGRSVVSSQPAGGSGTATNTEQDLRPPRVNSVDHAKPILRYAVGFGLIALCVGAVVIPGRREHDD